MSAQGATWSGSVTLRLGRNEAWDLMWRRAGQAKWLGPAARVSFDSLARSVLADDAGAWRTARMVKVRPGWAATLHIDAATSWGVPVKTVATIVLAIDDNDCTVVTVEESGLPAEHRDEVERYWKGRLVRLGDLARRVNDRRRNVRQAVVVIHGIGEQQPGATLGSLVSSGVLSAEDEHQTLWIKPDYFSESFELRRATLKATEDRPSTEVFEFYWAHVIRDTTLGQVASWLQRLLLRWPVPGPILPWWLLTWLLVLVALGAAGASFFDVPLASRIASGSLLVAGATALLRLLGVPLAIHFIGDAARYLQARPANVAHRQAIREAGVALIDRLHASGRYDRIVLLGHSLGSVIAYDIVTHAWTRHHGRHRRPGVASFKEIIAVEKALSTPVDAATAQGLQHDAWRRQRANTQPWLVTDLVTVGSPLTYADFLIGDGAEAFAQARRDRVLPTCPPEAEVETATGFNRITFDVPYHDPLGRGRRTFVQFHHAAPFAVTRWTNLYFSTRWLGIAGDLIGGPVAGKLGAWVHDVALTSPWWGFAHTRYWRRRAQGNEHLSALRTALRMDARQDLLSLLKDIPAFALVDDDEK